jgi:hypothetical protein
MSCFPAKTSVHWPFLHSCLFCPSLALKSQKSVPLLPRNTISSVSSSSSYLLLLNYDIMQYLFRFLDFLSGVKLTRASQILRQYCETAMRSITANRNQFEVLLAHVRLPLAVQTLKLVGVTNDLHLAQLASLPKLRHLFIENGQCITDKGLRALGNLHHLQKLNIWGCWRVTSVGVCSLASCSSLFDLELRACDAVDDEGGL